MRGSSIIKTPARWLAVMPVVVGCLLVHAAAAEEQSELLLDLEQQLQNSQGEPKAIARVAGTAVERQVDLPSLIVMYAGRNLIRVATETRRPPITVNQKGKPLRFEEGARDGGASELFLVLATMQMPRSVFREAVNKFVGEGDRVAKVTDLLVGTVKNYSPQALLKADRKTWPFPLCLPDCD